MREDIGHLKTDFSTVFSKINLFNHYCKTASLSNKIYHQGYYKEILLYSSLTVSIS